MKKYKDSGLAWIGSIPEDWKVEKLKRVLTIQKDISNKDNPIVLSLARDGVKVRDISTNEGQLAATYENYNSVKRGDLLLNPMDLISGANCSYSYVYGVISPAYFNLRAFKEYHTKYYDYFFKVQYWTLALFAHGKGVSKENRWTLNTETLKQYYVLTSSFSEQKKITDYLDDNMLLIDKIISENQVLIKKLKEYRQAIINEALTKGLDKNALLKDSGVKWIEEIPEGWNIKRLKYISRAPLMYGANEVASDENAEHPRYIRITDIDETGHLKTNTFKSLLPEIAKTYLLDKNDILFARSGASVGKTYIHESTTNACFAGYLIKFSVNSDIAMAKFIYYNTLTNKYLNWINRNTIQATIQNISAEKYNNYEIILPSLEKQNEIVNYLNCKTNKIGNTIMDIEQQITKLQEYKKSIISEAVTGKIKIEEHISREVI